MLATRHEPSPRNVAQRTRDGSLGQVNVAQRTRDGSLPSGFCVTVAGVALGYGVEEWSALAAVLAALAERVGASNACVTDAWGHLWCRGHALSPDEQNRVLALAREVVQRAPKPLPRGGRLEGGAFEDGSGWYARSFAGVYVVSMIFEGPFDEPSVRRALPDFLPRIEALTVALPPPDGPEATSGAAKQRA